MHSDDHKPRVASARRSLIILSRSAICESMEIGEGGTDSQRDGGKSDETSRRQTYGKMNGRLWNAHSAEGVKSVKVREKEALDVEVHVPFTGKRLFKGLLVTWQESAKCPVGRFLRRRNVQRVCRFEKMQRGFWLCSRKVCSGRKRPFPWSMLPA